MVSTTEIAKLPVEDRLKLVDFIWDTILADTDGPPITDDLRQFIDERLADIKRNPNDQCSWEEFRRSLPYSK